MLPLPIESPGGHAGANAAGCRPHSLAAGILNPAASAEVGRPGSHFRTPPRSVGGGRPGVLRCAELLDRRHDGDHDGTDDEADDRGGDGVDQPGEQPADAAAAGRRPPRGGAPARTARASRASSMPDAAGCGRRPTASRRCRSSTAPPAASACRRPGRGRPSARRRTRAARGAGRCRPSSRSGRRRRRPSAVITIATTTRMIARGTERLVGDLVERDDHDLGRQDEVGADRPARHRASRASLADRRVVRAACASWPAIFSQIFSAPS